MSCCPRLPGRAVVVGLVVAGSLGVGGVGNAYWSSTGTGGGTASTGTDLAVTLTPATATADLYPGGAADIVLGIANPGTSSVRVVSLELDTSRGEGGFDVDAPHAACSPLSVLDVGAQTNGGNGWDVPARAGGVDGALDVTLADALVMSGTAVDACQGATFTVFLSAAL